MRVIITLILILTTYFIVPLEALASGNGNTTIIQYEYKNEILEKLQAGPVTKKLLYILNTLECNDPYGFCLGGNHADAGPFQINQINREAHIHSEYLIRIGKKALQERKWEDALNIARNLYEFQAKWTMDRMGRFYLACNKGSVTELIRCQAIRHNGNNAYHKIYGKFKYYYGAKAVNLYLNYPN